MDTRNANLQAIAATLAAALLSTGALAQRQSPPPHPAPAGDDFLQAVNETRGTVKLELFAASDDPARGARAHMMACLQPQAGVRWDLGSATANSPNARVRLRVMQGDNCDEKQQVVCEHSIPRGPGLRHLALRGEGRRCGAFPMPAPAGGPLKTGNPCGGPWVPLTIENQHATWALWVTMYLSLEGNERNIHYSACWLPGETRMACVERRAYMLRAEMVGPNQGKARSCSDGGVRHDTQPGGPDSYGRLDRYRNASVNFQPGNPPPPESRRLTMTPKPEWKPLFVVPQ